MTIRIALIGSRELEKDSRYHEDVNLCYRVSYRLATLGVTMTSGLCELGMDGIAQLAYSKAIEDGKANKLQLEVYIKDELVRTKSTLPNKDLAILRNPKLIKETEDLASTVHPAWDRCNEWARGMHSRNCHQIFGYDLKNPVDAVICWTPNGNVQGGTATAIKLAMNANIPVFNLGHKDKEKILKDISIFLTTKGLNK